MSVAHSKTKAPIDVLNDLVRLRQLLQRSVATDLRYLYLKQQVATAERKLSTARSSTSRSEELAALEQAAASRRETLEQLEARPAAERGNPEVQRWYKDFEHDSFVWLTSDEPALRDLTEDVIDTLRCLRSADALRQRGTRSRRWPATRVFVSQSTASSIYALRSADTSKLHDRGRRTPQRRRSQYGQQRADARRRPARRLPPRRVPDDKTIRRAANNAALVINDIQADVIGSFRRPALSPGQRAPGVKTDQQMQVLVEHTEDNAGFAPLVCEALQAINPSLGSCSRPVPSLLRVHTEERMRYLAAEPFAGVSRIGEGSASSLRVVACASIPPWTWMRRSWMCGSSN